MARVKNTWHGQEDPMKKHNLQVRQSVAAWTILGVLCLILACGPHLRTARHSIPQHGPGIVQQASVYSSTAMLL
jgi:hypothetical protein